MKNGKTQWFDKFKRLYYYITINGGHCSYNQKFINSIKDCELCSICNWSSRCYHLIDIDDMPYFNMWKERKEK